MAEIGSTGADDTEALRPGRLLAEPATTSGPTVDLATLLGVTGAFALIATAMTLGGSLRGFIDVPALLIVLGGTTFVTCISYGPAEIFKSQGVLLRTLAYHVEAPKTAARRMLALAVEGRRGGSLSLEPRIRKLQANPFLRSSLGLVVDGLPADQIEQILAFEIEETAARHSRAAAMFRRAGEVAPAMGLIGTLIGLVQMLGRLDDPSAIGPAMAVALLTTFYGAVLAHMVFLPLAHKLERNAGRERMVKRIYATGAASISRGENPRRLEMILNTMLAPVDRLRFHD